MATLFLGDRAASTMVNSLAAQFAGGTFQLWASTQPANANTQTSAANYLLAAIPMSGGAATAVFPSASANVITATSTALPSTTAVSSGICVFYRVITSTGAIGIIDGAVSTAGADLNFNTNNFAQNASVAVTSYSITLPEN